jgi:uncharacterized protein YndB with AHSA1/START domain
MSDLPSKRHARTRVCASRLRLAMIGRPRAAVWPLWRRPVQRSRFWEASSEGQLRMCEASVRPAEATHHLLISDGGGAGRPTPCKFRPQHDRGRAERANNKKESPLKAPS